MSFLSRLGKFAGRVVGGVVSGQNPVSAVISASHPSQYATVRGTIQGPVYTGGPVQMGLPSLPAVIPGVGRVLSGGARALPGVVGGAARAARTAYGRLPRLGKAAVDAIIAAGGYVAGSQIIDAAGNLVGTRAKRRINPLNARALTRACRRIKSSRKILKKVERICGTTHRAAPTRKRRKC